MNSTKPALTKIISRLGRAYVSNTSREGKPKFLKKRFFRFLRVLGFCAQKRLDSYFKTREELAIVQV